MHLKQKTGLLGDYFSSNRLGDSGMATITNRYKKVTTFLVEIRAVMEYCRALVTGGIVTGIEIWETAVIPYLLNNSETWNDLPPKALEMLDDLQNQFLVNLLATPRTCPTPSLMWETGTISMGNKILKKKLLFYHHLLQLPEESLAWEVAQVQSNLALPGLISECAALVLDMELPEAKSCTKLEWKKLVNQNIKKKNRQDILDYP